MPLLSDSAGTTALVGVAVTVGAALLLAVFKLAAEAAIRNVVKAEITPELARIHEHVDTKNGRKLGLYVVDLDRKLEEHSHHDDENFNIMTLKIDEMWAENKVAIGAASDAAKAAAEAVRRS